MNTVNVVDIAKDITGYLENTRYYETVATYFHDILCSKLRIIDEAEEMQACLGELNDFFNKIFYCADKDGNISVATVGHMFKEQVKDLRNSYAEYPVPVPVPVQAPADKWKVHDQSMTKYTELQQYGSTTVPLETVMKLKYLTLVK